MMNSGHIEHTFHAFLESNDDPGSLITEDEITEEYVLNQNQYLPTPKQLVAAWS